MLTGEPPFNRATAQAILSAHVLDAPPNVTEKREHVPPMLGDLITRCLQKEKADRWQTAEEMLPLLESAATPSGGMTPTDTRPIKATPPASRRSRRFVIGSVAAAVVVVSGVGGWLALGGDRAPGPERMAVLPISDRSGSDGELVQALYTQLVVSLGQIPGVTVAPSSAMEIYRTQPKPAADIARELNVGAILEGNVFRAGQRMRITLQLTNPHTIEQIWSQSFDIDLSGDLFDAIDGVVPQIVEGIRKAVVPAGPSP